MLHPFNLVTHPPQSTHTQSELMGMKGHPQSNCGGGGGSGVSGGWMMNKKMVMVVVVILVGVIGVMVVQKVKDRRLFNLVIKDKDRQILTLNLLLQKERQYAKENKRKNQDLNAKLYSLRMQKIELNNKIMELRSTVGSMKDEQRALEMAIDEKQNEIKHKESEIKDLQSNLHITHRVWSVGSADPSNREVNLTSNVTTAKVKEILTPDVRDQKPKDEESEELAGSRDNNATIEMHNTTSSSGLTMKGRKFFTGAAESQRDKSNGQTGNGQLQANAEAGLTETARFKSNVTKPEADKMDEGEADKEVHINSSRNGSGEDQDYKEETEE